MSITALPTPPDALQVLMQVLGPHLRAWVSGRPGRVDPRALLAQTEQVQAQHEAALKAQLRQLSLEDLVNQARVAGSQQEAVRLAIGEEWLLRVTGVALGGRVVCASENDVHSVEAVERVELLWDAPSGGGNLRIAVHGLVQKTHARKPTLCTTYALPDGVWACRRKTGREI